MDAYADQGPDGAERPERPLGALVAVALIPLLVTLAFTGVVLFRARTAPAAAAPADATLVPPQAAAPAITGPTLTPGATTSTPASPAGSGSPTPSTGSGGPGGGSGGGGSGSGSGGGGGGSGGGGSGGGPPPSTTTTTQPPPPPPTPTVDCVGGRIRYTCTMSPPASGAVQVRWTRNNQSAPDWEGLSRVTGTCSAGEYVEVTATVSNAGGSASGWGWAYCEIPEPPCGPNPCPIIDRAHPESTAPSRRVDQ
jgi:hypothetical protein